MQSVNIRNWRESIWIYRNDDFKQLDRDTHQYKVPGVSTVQTRELVNKSIKILNDKYVVTDIIANNVCELIILHF